MKLIVGLGNPGPRYRRTRHNVGVRVLETVAARAGVALPQAGRSPARSEEEPSGVHGGRRFSGRFAEGILAGEPVGLLAPETFMNRSGEAVAQALSALPVVDPALDLLVVLDDADLPLGRLRLRPQGSSGGHLGLADVLARLGSESVPRLRFGIGRAETPRDTVDWVLEPFTASEEEVLSRALPRAADAVTCFVAEGARAAMNAFNGPWPESSVASTPSSE